MYTDKKKNGAIRLTGLFVLIRLRREQLSVFLYVTESLLN